MKLSHLACATAALLAPAAPARAGETACWFGAGVVIVPAQVMGVAGEYILDTGAARTQLHNTIAQTAGFAETALAGEVRLAGLTLPGQAVAVADLDLRTGGFPSVVSGVIGADVLRGLVLDVGFEPCRVGLYQPGQAPRFGKSAVLPLTWIAGRPTVSAGVSDGPTARLGAFAPATGADAPVRLSDALAAVPGAAKPVELYPGGVGRPTLRALSFAGALFENLPAGLEAAEAGGPTGEIGPEVLAHWRLRFDFPNGALRLKPAKK